MTNLRITNGFDQMSDAELAARANAILNAVTANAALPNPTPSVEEFQTGINDFSDALAIALTGSNYDKDLKNEKRDALITLLHNLSNFVLFKAAGNELIVKSAGFTPAKAERNPAPEVGPATEQQLQDGPNAGELNYSFKRVPGAKSYLYQCTPDPITESSVWEQKVGTVSKVRFSGLPSGRRIWCRVMAIGRDGQAVYSEPISRIVQ